MELLLIRHAEPVEEHTPDGSPADPALTERGRAQSEALARWLAREGLDVLYRWRRIAKATGRAITRGWRPIENLPALRQLPSE